MEDGIKSFPFPVKLDDRIKLIEAEFGITGYAVVWKLHQAIYSLGYYMKWDIDAQLLFIDDYRLSKVGRSCVSEIVAACLRRGVFESGLYERYQILTSERIQETFLTAKSRSKKVIMEKSYALPIVYTFIQNINKNGKNVNIFWKNADILQQKKGKEKKDIISSNNVVVISDGDYDDLVKKIGKDNADDYIERVRAFNLKNNKDLAIKSTALKWYLQDKKKAEAEARAGQHVPREMCAADLNDFDILNDDEI